MVSNSEDRRLKWLQIHSWPQILLIRTYKRRASWWKLLRANMNPITLELLRFTVDKSFSLVAPAFANLRQTVKAAGVKEQYYGLTDDNMKQLLWVIGTAPVHMQRLANFWRLFSIEWPQKIHLPELLDESSKFRQQVNTLDVNSKPISWLVPFRFAEEVRPALAAPVCEFVSVVSIPTTRTRVDILITGTHRTEGNFEARSDIWVTAQNIHRLLLRRWFHRRELGNCH